MFSDGRVLTHLVVVARLDAHWDLTLEKIKQNKESVLSGNCKKKTKTQLISPSVLAVRIM